MQGSWCRGQSPPDPESQFEMISFSMDPQWCGLLFSVYCRHEKGGFSSGFGQADAFAFSVAGPPLDADLIAWAGSFGFEICTVPSTWALILESVKATGFLLVVGVGGLFCYKLFNLCWARTRGRLSSSGSSSSISEGDGGDEEPLLGHVQGEYFGPKTSSHESLGEFPPMGAYQVWNAFGLGSNSTSPTEGGTSGDDEARDADVSDTSPCDKVSTQNPLRRQKHSWSDSRHHSPRTWRHPRHATATIGTLPKTRKSVNDSPGWLVGRINTMLKADSPQAGDVSLSLPITTSEHRKNKKLLEAVSSRNNLVEISTNQPNLLPTSESCSNISSIFPPDHQSRLPRDESYDSLGFSCRIPRQGSFDSTSSDISLDFSLPETIELEDTNTIVSLDKLQQEIDSLKSNCLMMDEDFETIKCNRNFPGMSSLMKANTSHSSLAAPNTVLDAESRDRLKQQKARACFAGLYSLTTIKNSTSSELSDSFPAPTHGRGSIGSADSLDWDSPKAAASPAKYTLENVSEDQCTTLLEETTDNKPINYFDNLSIKLADQPLEPLKSLHKVTFGLGELSNDSEERAASTAEHNSLIRLGLEDLEEISEIQGSESCCDSSPSIEDRRKPRRKVSTSSPVKHQNSGTRDAQKPQFLSEKSLAGSEDELMENLEWDEEDMTEYPEETDVGTRDELELSQLPTTEALEMDLEVELADKVEGLRRNASNVMEMISRSATASPLTERSSKMESSGIESKMADSMVSVQSSLLTSDWEQNSRPWGCWSSEESGFVECDVTSSNHLTNTARNGSSTQPVWNQAQSSTNVSEQSTPASETLPLDLQCQESNLSSSSALPLQNIGPKVNVLQYAVKEWQGRTDKAERILKGYAEIPKLLNLVHLRRIRGDNYCGIRAAIFQTLTQGLPVSSGVNTFHCLADAITGRGYSWLQDWSFAGRLPYRGNNVLHGMKTCLSSLDNVASLLSSSDNREELLANLLNSDPTLDLHIVEGVKLQMLLKAMELHDANSSGREVPLFAMLMFARDSSETPRDFMNNHLHDVGNTGGLEQVEMFLLGYTLGITIRVVRPAAYDTDDFICSYPDWNVGVWPEVVLIAEDDRHYNVLVD